MLGAAGFGRVHHAPMNDYAHAAVTTGTVAKGGVSSKAGGGMPREAAKEEWSRAPRTSRSTAGRGCTASRCSRG